MPAYRSIGSIQSLASIALFAYASSAHACQLCAETMTYNGFRFLALWFYIFLIWLVATFIASRRIPKFSPFRWALGFLGCMLTVGLVLGLNLLSLFLLPALLLPVVLRNPPAPAWLAKTAWALLAAMAVTVPLGYLLPKVLNEPDTRIRFNKAQKQQQAICADLTDYYRIHRSLPAELSQIFKDPAALADPFGYHLTSCLPADTAMLVFGYDHYKDGPRDPMAYVNAGPMAWIVSRGPDNQFTLPLNQMAQTSAAQLVEMTYDPTNGMFGPGDIFQHVSARDDQSTH